MKRTALAQTFTSILLMSVVAGVLVFKIAEANPWIIFEETTPIPGTTPPIITLFSPQNNTAYASNTVLLSFNVSKPQPPVALDAGISFIKYALDGNVTAPYFCDHYSSGSPPGIPEFSYSHELTVPDGKHTLEIYAAGVVLPGDMTIFGMDSSVTVFFSVGLPQSELEPAPSSSPSPSPSSSPQETGNQFETQPFPATLVVAIVSSVTVAVVGLAVYFGRARKRKVERV